MNYRILPIVIIALASILISCGEKPTGPAELKIISITPDSGFVGDTIIITGTVFGLNQDASYVSFPFAKGLEIISWSNTEIKLKVPAGAKSGRVSVIVNDEISNEVDFIVKIEFQTSTVTDIDVNIYKTVKIGNHWWMAENLNVSHYRNGDSIPQVTDSIEWANLTTGAWCYYENDPAMGAIFGKLYNWFAVTDPRGLGPEGWNTPNKNDWSELGDYLVSTDIAGGKLKSIGTIEEGTGLWHYPNEGATNESGFSAIPGGQRNFANGSFSELGYYGCYWSATVYELETARSTYLCNSSCVMNIDYNQRRWGFSVRCIKD